MDAENRLIVLESDPPVRKKTRRIDDAYAALKSKIMNNELAPGYLGTEVEIAQQLGMSRTPVHEALVRLQGDGFVALRGGVQVLPISARDLHEIYGLLNCLEPAAVEMLAQRGLPEEHPLFRELRDCMAIMEDAVQPPHWDSARWAAADERFHRLLLEHCGNARLARAAFAVWDLSQRARMTTLKLRPLPVRSNEGHRDVYAAIVRHDAEAAWHIFRAHRSESTRELEKLLRRFNLNSF